MTEYVKILLMSKRELAEWLSQKVFKMYYMYEECVFEDEENALIDRIIKEILEKEIEK